MWKAYSASSSEGGAENTIRRASARACAMSTSNSSSVIERTSSTLHR
ncbi:hypothetical protein SSAG_03521 [Streptomyces sp. Mg1]|nr:hypothetical protein SSAG_03521 [Streptomyces sp. Mg1]